MSNAGLSRRFASLVYDGLLLLAILFVATFLFIALFGSATHMPMRQLLQLYLYLVCAAYFLWCWLHGGQTLAMQTWRIRLTNIEGLPLAPAQAIKRYLLASAGLVFFGAGFLWALVDRESLFLHDRLLGTRLIQVSK